MGFFNARIFGAFFSLPILTLQYVPLSGDFRGILLLLLLQEW
jgi:hypothetical protein